MNDVKLARAGAVLSVLALTIFVIGLLIQIAGHHSALIAVVPGGTGLILVVTGAYLIVISRRGDADVAAAARLVRGAAFVAAAVVVVGVAAMAISGPGVVTTIILALLGLQAPIGLRMAANFLVCP